MTAADKLGGPLVDKIVFVNENDEEEGFFVLEQTQLAGNSYLLASKNPDDEEDEVWIFRQKGTDGEEVCYELIEDDKEIDAVIAVFEELLNEE